MERDELQKALLKLRWVSKQIYDAQCIDELDKKVDAILDYCQISAGLSINSIQLTIRQLEQLERA